jgi:hypothetical protein
MTDVTAPQQGPHLSLVSRLKGAGYLTSTASVFLLAVPGLKAALEQPVFGACVAAGIVTSIGGMFLRWRSHRLEQKEKGG